MRNQNDIVLEAIASAFGPTPYPGDAFLLGSREGDEPFEEVEPFRGKRRWQEIPPDFLDAHPAALSFFSEGALRFFLPAYLVADLNDRLRIADPVTSLIHAFSDVEVTVAKGERTFTIHSGQSALLNPQRYGAMTLFDYARCRFSVFTREEAGAIVAYLRYQRAQEDLEQMRDQIDAALGRFWVERVRQAPTQEDLRRRLQEHHDFLR